MTEQISIIDPSLFKYDDMITVKIDSKATKTVVDGITEYKYDAHILRVSKHAIDTSCTFVDEDGNKHDE